MPVNILSLFDTRNPWSQYTFFDFFDACFNYWSTEQILTFGRCRNVRKKQPLEKELKDYTLGNKNNGNAKETEKSKTRIKQQISKKPIQKDCPFFALNRSPTIILERQFQISSSKHNRKFTIKNIINLLTDNDLQCILINVKVKSVIHSDRLREGFP